MRRSSRSRLGFPNMMKNAVTVAGACALGLSFLPACGGGGGSDDGFSGRMDVAVVTNGFGDVLPYRIRKVDPSTTFPAQPEETLQITSKQILIDNVTTNNPVLPPAQFETSAVLPSNLPGNHFFAVTFTRPVDIDSVMDPSPGAQSNFGLSGTITLVEIDPNTGGSTPIPVRVFLNGQTYAGTPVANPDTGASEVPLQTWVTLENGKPTVNPAIDNDVDGTADGLGFPGTQGDFNGQSDLVSPRTMVFVVDRDGDLTTHEAFPGGGRTLKLRISTAVRAVGGEPLVRQAVAATTVGTDTITPEVATSPPPTQLPVITPGQGLTDIDPMTNITVQFTEPVQPLTVGSLPDGNSPLLSAAVGVTFGPSTSPVTVPFTAEPVSALDLTTYELVPTFNFPGNGTAAQSCGTFSRVDVVVNAGQVSDLTGLLNVQPAQTFFVTGEGPGVVNVPVTPDTIYVGRGGAVPGLSIIDLNGFGGGTGNPTYDVLNPVVEGNSNYPNNPNVALNGPGLIPMLPSVGQCTLDGGSAGVFTLSVDSQLNDRVVRAPIVTSVGDMMLGHSLDGTFNNGPFPFGCQSLGGNQCAFDGIKSISTVPNVDGEIPVPFNNAVNSISAGENLSNWAPHPNPPRINFPPLCGSPFLASQEPTSVDSVAVNLLVPGTNPFGTPSANIPPSTLLSPEQNAFFQGPSAPGVPIQNCTPYSLRQQVGHYLYMIDRGRREVLVLNSNRMTVIDRIATPDPTSLAMSPNLDLLAVSNQTADQVTFIDINPASATFHEIVRAVSVGRRPRGIAWEPGNEDILVCNESDSSVTIISALTLLPRKTVRTNLDRPFDVAITPRQDRIRANFGFQRNVYFAWIINRSGTLALFESGPNGIAGWGYDDVIGVSSEVFQNPKAIQPDYVDLRSGCWVVHEGPINPATGASGPPGIGAVTNYGIVSAQNGQITLTAATSSLRDLDIGVFASIGASGEFSGVPVDVAFDNMRHFAGLPNYIMDFSAGNPLQINGKGIVRLVPPGNLRRTTTPAFMFVAVPAPFQGSGVVDVIRIDGSNFRQDTNPFQPGVQSIPVPDVTVLMDYFRQ